jgi:hypothetical protein
MFLDSAQLPSSVISHAKSLNYTPRSYKSSTAVLNATFAQNGLSAFSIPLGTKFTGVNSNGSFTYVTRSSTILYPSGGFFVANNLSVFEGKYLIDSFVVDSAIQNQRFIISNQTIDTDSLSVLVMENNGANTTYFTQAQNLYGLTNTSNVYFIQATENAGYEIVFGDNVSGRTPLNGSTILANYMITSGTDGNGANTFSLADNLGSYNGYGSAIIPNIVTSTPSFNGANNEQIESIRFNAPRSYATQQSATTLNDYIQLILQNYSDIKSVHVYGGETLTTNPTYGTVYIVPATYSGFNLSINEKNNIINFISKRNTLGITPIIVDPSYLYLDVFSTVKFDSSKTSLSPANIQALVTNNIVTYNSTYLEDFNKEFKLSDFMTSISSVDPSITSNETYVIMKKIVSPLLNSPTSITVAFNNAIEPGSFSSSQFVSNNVTYSYTDYNPKANSFSISQLSSGLSINNNSNIIYLTYTLSSGTQIYINAGSIDYVNGIVTLGLITINNFLNNSGINFYATATTENVTSMNNDILTFDVQAGISVNIIAAT